MRRWIGLLLTFAAAVASISLVPASFTSADSSGAAEGDPRLNATAIAAGGEHTCVIVTNGRVACWGSDEAGQLGNGDAVVGNVTFPGAPVVLPAGTSATSIVAGASHTCALLNTGAVTCWGSDASGQLGSGDGLSVDVTAPPTPIALPSGATAVAITAGEEHSCAVLTTGQVTCWGSDSNGQLGNGAVSGSVSFPVGRVLLATGTRAVAATAGATHTCVLLASGDVSCWGSDLDGQQGNGSALTSDVQSPGPAVALPGGATALGVSAGGSHTCVLLAGGEASCWGANATGQLGIGTTASLDVPSSALSLPGDAVAIAAGEASTCVVVVGGGVSCWGSDANGRLGNGPGVVGDLSMPPSVISMPMGAASSAVVVGGAHACALLVGGLLSCWGADTEGQVGNGVVAGDIDAPGGPVELGVVLPGGAQAVAVAGGGSHTCALLSTGEVTCWGSDSQGQLGNGAVTGSIASPPAPVLLPNGSTATAITAGANFTCALLESGEVTCWGQNSSGQLGNGTTDNLDAPSRPIALPGGASALAIAGGNFYACAILDTSDVTCWGNDGSGQLGNGAITGNVLAPPSPIALPGGASATQIVAGVAHTCALLSTNRVTCWGLDGFGQVGNGASPTGNLASPSSTLVMPAGTSAVAVTAGSFHTCALLDNARVTCWGFNINGQLGNGNINVNSFSPPAPISFVGFETAISVTAGDRHSCALLSSSRVTCWGLASSGQLGTGATSGEQSTPTTPITMPGGADAVGVSADGSTTCAVLEAGQLSCWGSNSQGQVGNDEPGVNAPVPVLAGGTEIVDPQAFGQLPRPMPLAVPSSSLTGTARPGTETVVDPVSTATGNLTGTWTDLSEPVFGMRLVRSYNGLSDLSSPLGDRWSLATGPQLLDGDGVVEVLLSAGSRFAYSEDGVGGFTAPTQIAGALIADAAPPVGGGGLPMLRMEYENGDVDRFDTAGRLLEQTTWSGQSTVHVYNADGTVDTITSSTGLTFGFTYASGRTDSMTSSTGRSVSYGYDGSGLLTSVTDEFGAVTTMTYTVEGWLDTLTDSSGVVLEDNVYDAQGRVVSQVQPSGAVFSMNYVGDGSTIVTDSSTGDSVTYLHDEFGKVIAIVDPFDEVVQRLYDDNGNLVENLSRSDRYSTSEYDANYNLIARADPDGNTTTYTYDALNRVATITTRTGATTTFAYDGDERIPSTTTDTFGATSTSVVENGLVRSTTDADGVTTTYTYDPQRRPATTTDGLGNTTTTNYDARGRVESTVSPSGRTTTFVYGTDQRLESVTAPDGGVTAYTYDARGRTLTVTDPMGAVTENVYNADGELLAVAGPQGTTTFTYDDNGRRTSTNRPGNAASSTTYDPLGRVDATTSVLNDSSTYGYNVEGQLTSTAVGSTGAESATAYDVFGRVETITDPASRQVARTYDSFGRLVSLSAPGGATVGVEYDDLDRMTAVVDARSGRTESTYSSAGRVKTNTSPDGITTTYGYDAAGRLETATTSDTRTTTYTRNAEGELLALTSAAGLTTSYTYDAAGRVATTTDPSGVVTRRTYTLRGELATEQVGDEGAVSYTYNPDGTLEAVTDALGNTTSMAYDGRGNMLTRTDALGGTESWTYNTADQITAMTDPLGRVTTAGYDAAGRLIEVEDPAGRQSTINYNIDSTIASVDSTQDGNTITSTYGYDAAGRIASIAEESETVAYQYSPAGDLLERASSVSGTVSYTYDTAGRRTTLSYPDGNQLLYGYDAAGRVATIDLVDASGITPVASYEYDPDGRVRLENLVDGTRTHSYTDGLLTSFAQDIPGSELNTTFSYDTTGRIASETTGTAIPDESDGGGSTLCGGIAATIIGTNGGDVLNGTNGDDVIVGLGGNDTINGGNGFDLICAGDGNDTLNGANGNDTINGGNGNDTLNGANGDDTLNGNSGDDTIGGANGNDTAHGGDGNDNINGGKGDDVIDGGNGVDGLIGDTGTDACDDAETVSGCETITNNGEASNAITINYTYDNASQLTAANPTVGSPTTWTYDALGRRATQQVGTDATQYAYDAAGQLCWTTATPAAPDCSTTPSGATTYSWDDSGRLTAETSGVANSVAYTYDAAGRLADTSRVAITLTTTQARRYDADGMLAALDTQIGTEPTATSTLAWDPVASGVPNLVAISDAQGPTNLVSGPAGWAGLIGATGIEPIASDGYGSTVSSIGNPLARDDTYNAFGTPGGVGTFEPRLGYRGELTLDNQLHLRARNYQADVGRFTSRDLVNGVAGTTTLVDPYHYVNNDPLNRIDPTGFFADATYTPDPAQVYGSEDPSLALAFGFGLLRTAPAAVPAGVSLLSGSAAATASVGFFAGCFASFVCGLAVLAIAVVVISAIAACIVWCFDSDGNVVKIQPSVWDPIIQDQVNTGDRIPGYHNGFWYEPEPGSPAYELDEGLSPEAAGNGAFSGPPGNCSAVGSYSAIRGEPDAHHIIQHAAAKATADYSRSAAPAITLTGPSTEVGTPHYEATQVQRTARVGGTYRAERQIAADALRAAGCTSSDVSRALEAADAYFIGQLGLNLDSPMRIPLNRTID